MAVVAQGQVNEGLLVTAARALGRLGDDASLSRLVDDLVTRYDEPSSLLFVGPDGEEYRDYPRATAAYVMGALGHDRATDYLIIWLDDSDPGTREAAALALGAIGGMEAVDALSDCAIRDDYNVYLGDPIGHPGHYTVRCAAFLALRRIGASLALSRIIKAQPEAEAAAEEWRRKVEWRHAFRYLGYT
jgi:HEAT repeat protein